MEAGAHVAPETPNSDAGGRSGSFFGTKQGCIAIISRCLEVRGRNESQGSRVQAIPQTSGRGSVVEDVPQVRIGEPRAYFRPRQDELEIGARDDITGLKGLRKTGPTSA
jgi:hypothetical protein